MSTQPHVAEVFDRVWAGFAPPPDLSVSEFCDQELVVTTGPLAGTRWQTDFAPYQRGILNAFDEPGVEMVVCRTSAQVGKTSLGVGLVGYHIAHDPCPILVVEPTVDPMARDFAKNRLDPVIMASPILRDSVSKKRSKDSANTILSKHFRGGHLDIAGANSAASLAARSIRVLIGDEIDRWPAELRGEGSTIQIALKRTAAYRGRRRILLLSTPTLKDAPIDAHFKRGDQRRFYVPCPGCSYMHPFEWRNVRWTDDDPATARLACPSCDRAIDEAERVAILSLGEWRAEAEPRDPGVASFHLWEAYSPFSSLREIVGAFLRARAAQKAGDRGEMHTWQNTSLGEPIEPEAGEGVEPHMLLQRAARELPWVGAPGGVVCLTVGVDTQDDRLEALVVGWGPGEESWIVDRRRLPGDPDLPGVWTLLDELLGETYAHPSGRRLEILAGCIDSAGHKTTKVYEWVLSKARAGRRMFATIGRPGQRPIVSAPSPKHWGTKPRPVDLYTVGVDAAKALIMGRLTLEEPGPGHVHIPPADWADEDLANQLTSERLVTRYSKGMPVQEWRLVRPGVRNEGLDCLVLSLAALRLSRIDLKTMALRMAQPQDRQPPKVRRPRGGGLDVPDNWLERRR